MLRLGAEHTTTGPLMTDRLPDWRDVTVVCAHPDDESFGLGAIIAGLATTGADVRLVCFTAGERSTLGAGPDLATRRARELDCAAEALGIADVELLDHPDGSLADVAVEDLADVVTACSTDADALLTFDRGGITGHPDHQQATAAAITAGRRLDVPVWGWALTEPVARTLREQFRIPFVGRSQDDLDLVLEVDRERQRRAITCHGSQLTDNPVPHRRIELQGPIETLRLLHGRVPTIRTAVW